MTGNAQKQVFRVIGFSIAVFVLFGTSIFALQEKISLLSDYQYNKIDFPRYEGIKKEADVQKRADLLLAFVKQRAISKILLYVANDYMDCVKQLAKNDMAKAASMLETLWALLPTDQTIQAAEKAGEIQTGVEEFKKDQLLPTQKTILGSLTDAYYQSKNYVKAAELAEKTYELAPDKSALPILLQIYALANNTDKVLTYGQKILAEFPIDQFQGYNTAITLAQIYIQKQDVKSATEMLSKVMEVYGDKVPPGLQEAQWNPTRAFAYGVIAPGVYQTKDYVKALELYEKVAKFDPKREDAYYFIGMCKWQNKDPEGAIVSFAKCVVLNKTYAPRAQKYLEDLYKARHNNTLDGLDQVLAKAKSELGL